MEYYIILKGQPKEVAASTLKQWLELQGFSVCVAETHLIHARSSRPVAVISTRYTGCDASHYKAGLSEHPLLWETRMRDEVKCGGHTVWNYPNKEDAKAGHERYVEYFMDIFHRHIFEVTRKDIDI